MKVAIAVSEDEMVSVVADAVAIYLDEISKSTPWNRRRTIHQFAKDYVAHLYSGETIFGKKVEDKQCQKE